MGQLADQGSRVQLRPQLLESGARSSKRGLALIASYTYHEHGSVRVAASSLGCPPCMLGLLTRRPQVPG